MTIEIGNGPKPEIRMNKDCWKVGCTTKPDWQVAIVVYGLVRDTKHPAVAESGVVICTEHRPEITVEHMVTDRSWKMICDGFRLAGKLAPTRSLTKLQFLPLLNLEGGCS